METFFPALASGAVSAALAAFGCYVALTNRLTRLETMIDTLTKTVEKHNHVVERTALIERDLDTMWRRIDEHTEEIKDIGKVKIGGTS